MKDLRKLFGTDGIRGVANKELTAELALRVGRAGAKFLVRPGKKGKVIVGRDPRPSGDFIEGALISGILSSGVDVLCTGIIPTPAIALIVKILDLDGGVVISASHNPLGDNGIKFFGKGGQKLTDKQENSIEDYLMGSSKEEILPTGMEVGRVRVLEDATDIYINYLLENFDLDLSGFKIAIDCANGSASITVKKTLARLGARVVDFNTGISGENINKGCGSTHPEELQKLMADSKADIGFAYDGDGDRVVCCDRQGRVLDGDNIIAFCALSMLQNGSLENNSLVTTVMANMGFSRAMADSGIKVYKTQVGDRYVLEKMLESGSVLGGEQSGHIIFSNISPTGDGLLSTLELLKVLIDGKKDPARIYDIFTRYPQLLKNIRVKNKSKIMGSEAVRSKVIEMEDMLGPDGRILLRLSGTEPVIRVMAEAKTMDMVNRAVEELSRLIEDCNRKIK